jgi:transposase
MQHEETKNPLDLSDSELYALYNSGPEITISFIKYILDRIRNIESVIKKQEAKIQELKAIISKNSQNSSKPPSSDGLSKKSVIKNLRKKSKRKSGGQPGHPGTNLKLTDTPDVVHTMHVERCCACGGTQHLKIKGQKRRQVIDVEIKKTVTEYQADISECFDCGEITTAAFPKEVTQDVQYGSVIEAIIIYMRNQNYIPTERLTEMCLEVFDIPVSEGTITNITNRCSELLKPFDDYVKNKLRQEPVVMFDESGIRIEGSLHWVHSAGTSLYTYYLPHKRRGKLAMDEMGILSGFQGTAIHDGWQSYFDYCCKHGLCNAHHLRELIFLHEEMGQRWAFKMIELLLEIKEKVEKAKAKGMMITENLMHYYRCRFKRIIRSGFRENPVSNDQYVKKRGRRKKGKIICLLERLKTRIHQVLAFMYDFDVPFDNNQAERDIRMAKLQQKVSGCFRSMEGASDFFRIRSFLSTLRKHKMPVLCSLKNLFQTESFYGIMAE